MTDATLARTFAALSDPLRRRVLALVAQRPDATVTEICDAFPVSRFAVMRHLNVLEAACMIERRSEGRERRLRLAETAFEAEVIEWLTAVRKGDPPT